MKLKGNQSPLYPEGTKIKVRFPAKDASGKLRAIRAKVVSELIANNPEEEPSMEDIEALVVKEFDENDSLFEWFDAFIVGLATNHHKRIYICETNDAELIMALQAAGYEYSTFPVPEQDFKVVL